MHLAEHGEYATVRIMGVWHTLDSVLRDLSRDEGAHAEGSQATVAPDEGVREDLPPAGTDADEDPFGHGFDLD